MVKVWHQAAYNNAARFSFYLVVPISSPNHHPALTTCSGKVLSMTSPTTIDTKTLVTITITFNPDLELLKAQLLALPSNCSKILVDNASSPAMIDEIKTLITQLPHTELLCNEKNLGLAAAINIGIHSAKQKKPHPYFVLLLDQDSEPGPNSIEIMLETFTTLSKTKKIGCIGPQLLDPDTGLAHGFHQSSFWRWKRVYPLTNETAPVPCASLNGSGTLAPLALFLELGGLDELLFIDHVDTEWSFRVTSMGYSLWGAPHATFHHKMGERGNRFWFFGWHIWPVRSHQRHYFLFRNAVLLIRRSYVPLVWKAWAILKVILTMVITAILGPHRRLQLRSMARGLRHGNQLVSK